MRRVVVTGIGAISPLGSTWEDARARLEEGRNLVTVMENWMDIEGLNTKLGVPVEDFKLPEHYTRKQTRSMGRVAGMSVVAAERALDQAGLLGSEFLTSGGVGVSFGSSTGSTDAQMEFGKMILNRSTDGLNATTYVRMMSHTAAVNIAVFFGVTGRVKFVRGVLVIIAAINVYGRDLDFNHMPTDREAALDVKGHLAYRAGCLDIRIEGD